MRNSRFPLSSAGEGASYRATPALVLLGRGRGSRPPATPGLLTWKAVALKSEVARRPAGASVDAGGRGAGHVGALAVLAREARGALALVGAGQVDAGAAVLALSRGLALVDVGLALLPREAGEAPAGELVGHGGAGASVCTGLGQAGVSPLAQLPWRSENWAQSSPPLATPLPRPAGDLREPSRGACLSALHFTARRATCCRLFPGPSAETQRLTGSTALRMPSVSGPEHGLWPPQSGTPSSFLLA